MMSKARVLSYPRALNIRKQVSIFVLELGGIPVLVVTQGIDFIPVLFFRIPVYLFNIK